MYIYIYIYTYTYACMYLSIGARPEAGPSRESSRHRHSYCIDATTYVPVIGKFIQYIR